MKSPDKPRLIARFDAECGATRDILTTVGDTWSVLVVVALQDGPQRFGALKRSLDVTQRMLTLTVRRLERDGLVRRTVLPGKPPGVDYALTPLGESLIEPLVALATWAQAHRGDVAAARAEHVAAAERVSSRAGSRAG